MGIRRVMAQRDEINRINVFPLADRDTGTNLSFTLGAVLQGVREPRFATASEVLHRAAAEAIDAARGNSGAILACFFQGVAEVLEPGLPPTPEVLARAALGGSSRARKAMTEPREGTILSVIQAFAEEMQTQAGTGTQDIAGGGEARLPHALEHHAEREGQVGAGISICDGKNVDAIDLVPLRNDPPDSHDESPPQSVSGKMLRAHRCRPPLVGREPNRVGANFGRTRAGVAGKRGSMRRFA